LITQPLVPPSSRTKGFHFRDRSLAAQRRNKKFHVLLSMLDARAGRPAAGMNNGGVFY
jgi:hypothetical protein